MATAHQQFSLKWNNYAQHIVTALEELRVDDELTDVTLSADGQRIKAHKILLSACSVFFKETFKENPCKHPVVILKGVTFQDLQAIVQFMYNGQVNVTQERLPSFLQTAEILQIKGLTDSASDKEETATPAPAIKKRPQSQTFPPQASSTQQQHIDSIRQEVDRPPTPKRKRIIGSNTGTFASAQNSELPGTASVISATGGGSSNANNGHLHNNNSHQHHQSSIPPPLHALNSDNSGDGLPVKYEDQQELDEEYDRDEDSYQENNERDLMRGESELTNSLGSGKIRTSANGPGERRPRYNMQPSSNDLLAATGVVDATNGGIVTNCSEDALSDPLAILANVLPADPLADVYCDRPESFPVPMTNQSDPQRYSVEGADGEIVNFRQNGVHRDLIFDGKQGSFVTSSGVAINGNGYMNSNKLRHRLISRSLSSGSVGQQQQEDRVIKYAPMQNHNGHSQDSRSNSSQEGAPLDARFHENGSDSPQGSDEDNDQYPHHMQQQRRRLLVPHQSQIQNQKSRSVPHLLKTNNIHSSQHQGMVRNTVVSRQIKGEPNRFTNGSNGVVEDLSVSSPAHDLSTPNFSLTQQLLQQNVLSLISQNGGDAMKNGSSRAISGPPTSSSPSMSSNSNSNGSNGSGMGSSDQLPLIAPYVCDICGKRYVHHRSLNDHKKSHTGATRCPVCNKSFSKVANMRAHYTAQHGSGSQNNDGIHNGDSNNSLNEDNQLSGRVSLKSSA